MRDTSKNLMYDERKVTETHEFRLNDQASGKLHAFYVNKHNIGRDIITQCEQPSIVGVNVYWDEVGEVDDGFMAICIEVTIDVTVTNHVQGLAAIRNWLNLNT